ncbi:MAG: citrate lyase holo-[Lachnospiraceae bacterium]|nr:citrate lyase holo-[acyl-carrier protein] synthase [Lachnospiraceae bacterium]MBR4768403.1 citrate lyase holo-[acyl-carrier protein] synthase [Lachnospiraceae bacterium]
MSITSLSSLLNAREKRVRERETLLHTFGCPVLTYTLNIPGAEKDSALIRRFFKSYLDILMGRLAPFFAAPLNVVYPETGPECMVPVRMDANELKRIAVEIESSSGSARLLDLDVTDASGRQVSRTDLGFPERECIVCGKIGRQCAAAETHPKEEVVKAAVRLMEDHFLNGDASVFADLAVQALIREVHLTPKPGLVDEANPGSHRDMDLKLMETSAYALKPYFHDAFLSGTDSKDLPAEEAFARLKELGLEGEKTMFSATGGVNTHKGAVYLFGCVLGAVGRLWRADRIPRSDEVLKEAGTLSKKAAEDDLSRIARKPKGNLTAGEAIYRQYGLTGARGEAMNGFPSVRNTSLPYLRSHAADPLALQKTLLMIIALGNDTNLIARGGRETAMTAVSVVRDLLKKGEPARQDIERLDRLFIEKNLSPGGSADLIAVTVFCRELDSFADMLQ